ncbi:caspase family protein [Streptomyces sp. NPDC004270]
MYRALLICNSVYPFEPVQLPKLLGPVRDGLAMWSALTDAEKGGLFDPENVEVLFECDKDEILKTANRFFQDCDPDDVLLFYYSGHGKQGRSNLHLCARDTTVNLLPSSSVSGNELKGYMETSPAQSIIVILDCCHAGAFKGDPPQISATSLAGKGRFVMTASGPAQKAADAPEAGHPSPFTRALVDGLRRAEPRSAQETTLVVDDVYDYAVRTLPKDLPQPQRRVNGAGDAVIAKRPNRSSQGGKVVVDPSDRAEPESVRREPDTPTSPSLSLLQGLGFGGADVRRATPSLGDRLSWRMFLLSSCLVGLFSYLAWQAWMDDISNGYDGYSGVTEFFFQCCGFLAALSALGCIVHALVSSTSRWARVARTLRFVMGLVFGGLWLYSVVGIGLNSSEQALLQSSMVFFCVAAVMHKRHDSLFLAGAAVAFAGVLVPAGNGGYRGVDMSVVIQALVSAGMVAMWYFGAPERYFTGAAAVSLAPGTATLLIHGYIPGVSVYGTSLALLSAALGDGTRPAEGSRSLVHQAWRAAVNRHQTRALVPRPRR